METGNARLQGDAARQPTVGQANIGPTTSRTPPIRRLLQDLQVPLHLEGRLPGGHLLEQSFVLHQVVEHRGEPALICSCPAGRRRRFLLRHLDTVTEAASGKTHYDPHAWFRGLVSGPAPAG